MEPPDTGAEDEKLGAAVRAAFCCSRRAMARFRRASCCRYTVKRRWTTRFTRRVSRASVSSRRSMAAARGSLSPVAAHGLAATAAQNRKKTTSPTTAA